jgi:hypothetical protein
MELVDVYYLAFPKDRRLLKLAVTWVYLVGAVQTILALFDLNFTLNLLQESTNGCGEFQAFGGHFELTVIAFSAAGEDFQVPHRGDTVPR